MADTDADRIAQHLYGQVSGPAMPSRADGRPILEDTLSSEEGPRLLAEGPPLEEADQEEPINITALLADTVSSARLLVGEAGYPHHYITDNDQQLRMAICEMYAPDVEFTDAVISQCDKLFKWIKTGEVPNGTQKPTSRLGVIK